ncbi:sterol 3-beta-glucosyltransferase [Bimuria novae-zelandiae CBS 107.79]|uniref:Sterol 3-beta-glucosyltransferase n=1 Tax=Bimuria novae-zelandiae CBS 107.79 TaxID=1447943 RepID=A0A6A5VRS1_9PLEO|nr:sterol 3-beta-glucosyltransferase [Bimuria novae-zelandiae CBS 107.79]
MAAEERSRERPVRKLMKKRKEPRRVSLDIPERFKDAGDADEDVAVPKQHNAISMHQSIFSMIARVGQQSQTDLGLTEEVDSGDSDDEARRNIKYGSLDGAARMSRLSSIHDFQRPLEDVEEGKPLKGKHRRSLSEHKLLRSLPKLKPAGRKESKSEAQATGNMSSSQFLPPRQSEDEPSSSSRDETLVGNRPTPASGEKLQVGKRRGSERKSRQGSTKGVSKSKTTLPLANRLQQIFEFEDLEEVISEYPCWLLQSVLLQGYMYITQKHICFYAYIPKKHHDVSKTGYLSKRGRSKYNRYWFILRGDVLGYYTNPTELYFPRNRINLQYAVSAEVLESKDKHKDETIFTVTTDEKTFRFKADSAVSAKEWVRSIQKVIFRTHNEGNSVKISLPIRNVLEIEESTILDFAETVKIRVIDNDETYAIDEYFFSFFSQGKDALNVLRIMINDNEHHQTAQQQGEHGAKMPPVPDLPSNRNAATGQDSPGYPPYIEENVRATLSPLPGQLVGRSSMSADSRSSLDIRKSLDVRRSMDASRTLRRPSHEIRRSFSRNRHDKQSKGRPGENLSLSAKRQDTSDSATNSVDPGTESSAHVQSMDESNASASQILDRSDVFRAPTLHPDQATTSERSDDLARHSQDTTRSSVARPLHSKSPRASTKQPSGPGPAHASRYKTDNAKDLNATDARLSTSSTALQDMASYPLQKAAGLAGFLRKGSKKMGNLLQTESMGYYEKVSGMLAGGRKHYQVADELRPNDQVDDPEEDDDAFRAAQHFQEHFSLPTEQLQSSYFAHLQRLIPNYGKIYISNRSFCFRTLVPTFKTKVILPIRDIETINKEKGFRLGYHGLVVVIRGHEELFFEFAKAEHRDECAIAILRILESTKYIEDEQSSNGVDSDDEAAKAEHDLLQAARDSAEGGVTIPTTPATDFDRFPLIFDDPQASIVDFKPSEPLKIVCLTIGSRGDVQPYIALCKDLIKEGHKPVIATHDMFEDWVTGHGIGFAPVAGDPAELMRLCVQHGMFSYGFLKETNSKFRGWLEELCETAWKACQGADLLIESPSAMIGIHIAEALRIPYFRAFTMPWTRTRAYPHAFAVGQNKMGGHVNSSTYVMIDKVFWVLIANQVNRWRRNQLKLRSTSQARMNANERPFLYNFSQYVVPPPCDWPDWIRVTGYWFLDEGDDYQPPDDLQGFLNKARADKKKVVYIGFGSIVFEDPATVTKTIIEAVLEADVRCILSKGWSDRWQGDKGATQPDADAEIPLPPEIFKINAVPHDWLFKQVDAVVHHGGSGTTGASLRQGKPTIIKPFFGDQFFFATRVEDLGVGIYLKKINTKMLGKALWEATNSERMRVKARVLGHKIRKENGTQVAIQTIYRELDRARNLSCTSSERVEEEDQPFGDVDADWTLIDDEGDLQDVDLNLEAVPSIREQTKDGSQPVNATMALNSMFLAQQRKQ